MSDIIRYRGDTRRIRKTFIASGVAIDITGWSFVLTVNAVESPIDIEHQVAQIVGMIADAPNGIVDFTPTLTDVETAGNYFYDIQAVDVDGAISTLDKGRFILLQDITKSRPGQTWTPDGVDDEDVPIDGTGFWIVQNSDTLDSCVYQTRDGIKVMRTTISSFMQPSLVDFRAIGADSVLHGFGPFGTYRFEVLVYALDSPDEWEAVGLGAMLTWSEPTAVSASLSFASALINIDALMQAPGGGPNEYTDGPVTITVPGWVRFAVEISFDDRTVKAKAWDDDSDEPVAWDVELECSTVTTFAALICGLVVYANDGVSIDVAEWSWERVG